MIRGLGVSIGDARAKFEKIVESGFPEAEFEKNAVARIAFGFSMYDKNHAPNWSEVPNGLRKYIKQVEAEAATAAAASGDTFTEIVTEFVAFIQGNHRISKADMKLYLAMNSDASTYKLARVLYSNRELFGEDASYSDIARDFGKFKGQGADDNTYEGLVFRAYAGHVGGTFREMSDEFYHKPFMVRYLKLANRLSTMALAEDAQKKYTMTATLHPIKTEETEETSAPMETEDNELANLFTEGRPGRTRRPPIPRPDGGEDSQDMQMDASPPAEKKKKKLSTSAEDNATAKRMKKASTAGGVEEPPKKKKTADEARTALLDLLNKVPKSKEVTKQEGLNVRGLFETRFSDVTVSNDDEFAIVNTDTFMEEYNKMFPTASIDETKAGTLQKWLADKVKTQFHPKDQSKKNKGPASGAGRANLIGASMQSLSL